MSQRARSLVAPALATVVGVAVLVSLGVWQLQRLAWKEALIAAVESRVHAAPVDLPAEADWPRLNPTDYEYRHVHVAGVYDASRQALVFRALGSPRGRYGGPGYLVMTPLRLASGAVVLVNRGFVPQDRKDKAALSLSGSGAGETVVVGLMRASEDRTWFTPADNPASGQWFTRDVEAMARAMGLSRYAPFSIDADAGADPAELPEGGETIVAFPNSHLSYAMTWFGMALALAGVFGAYAVTQLRAGEKYGGRSAPVDDGDGGR
ncbi:MAG: SURF1 family protein [Roseiarcus sp.]|jgi:surfeit locus 1 family protein